MKWSNLAEYDAERGVHSVNIKGADAPQCTGKNVDSIKTLHTSPCARLGYSQGNQDCMIDAIFDMIGITNHFFVEYGFNTPDQCSGSGPNTCKLSKDGWKGLLLDGENHNESINLHNHYLYRNNIVDILKKYKVPRDFDFLSSDMDSHDFFVLESILKDFRPRVVTTEYNSNWPIEWTISQADPSLFEDLWDLVKNEFKFRQCIWGASPSALNGLMQQYGYRLIGVTPSLDLFWARKDLLACYDVPDFAYFVERMALGELNHGAQKNSQYKDWLMDTNVWLETGNAEQARQAARDKISSMIQSGSPLPCFSNLR